MATKVFGAANKKWSEESAWGTGEPIPGIGDDVVFNASSGECTVGSTQAKCRTILTEGYTKKITFTTGKIQIGTSTAPTEGTMENTAIKLSSNVLGAGAVFGMFGTSATAQKIYMGGNSLTEITFTTTGKYQLEEEFKTIVLSITKGELKTNGQTVTASEKIGSTGAATRVLNLGSSVVKLTGEGTVWQFGETTGLTLTAGSSTIEITNTALGGNPVFTGGGLTYGTLTVSGNFVQITDSNTFGTLNVNTSRAKKECKATLATNKLTRVSGTEPRRMEEVRGTAIPTGTIITKEEGGGVFAMSAEATETVGVAENVEIFPAGLLLTEGTLQTVTSLTTNGKATEPARLSAFKASNEAPVAAHKIKAAGVISTKQMIVSWSKAETGEFYDDPEGEESAINRGNNTNWKFEAAPSGALVNAQSMIV